jgi:hypothetical protein
MPVTHSISFSFNDEILVVNTTLSDHRLTAFADRLKECNHVIVVRSLNRFDSGLANIVVRLFKGYNRETTINQITKIFNESLL